MACRFILNMKGLPYKTVWVEYPDIADLYTKLGARNEEVRNGKPFYGLPVIYDPATDIVIPESRKIAQYLDETYPSTPDAPLLPAGTMAFQAMFVDIFTQKVTDPLHLITSLYAMRQLPVHSREYYKNTREARFGMSLGDTAPEGSEKRAAVWKGVREGFKEVHKWIGVDGRDKLFMMGDRLSFVDVVIASYLTWFKRLLGEESQEWKELMIAEDGRWARLSEAFAAWEVVDEDGLKSRIDVKN
jgi:glutathione S-transferase